MWWLLFLLLVNLEIYILGYIAFSLQIYFLNFVRTTLCWCWSEISGGSWLRIYCLILLSFKNKSHITINLIYYVMFLSITQSRSIITSQMVLSIIGAFTTFVLVVHVFFSNYFSLHTFCAWWTVFIVDGMTLTCNVLHCFVHFMVVEDIIRWVSLIENELGNGREASILTFPVSVLTQSPYLIIEIPNIYAIN